MIDEGHGTPVLDVAALERAAAAVLDPMALAYYAGGAGEERLLDGAVAAWDAYRFLPRVLRDVSVVDTATTLLGHHLDYPIVVAPTALHGLAHPEAEVATATGAAAAGAAFTVSSLATTHHRVVAEVPSVAPRFFQLYVGTDRAATADLVDAVREAGYAALVLTVDAPVAGRRLRERRAGVALPVDLSLPNLEAAVGDRRAGEGFMATAARSFDASLTPNDVAWLADRARLPVLVKGVLRPDDAVTSLEAGAAGVVVSNHGARQLDGAQATAHCVARIRDAVGADAVVLVDGGVRNGEDVARAIALGANAVAIGRPVLWALATGGATGVCQLLRGYHDDLARTMALLGAASIDQLDRTLLEGPTW